MMKKVLVLLPVMLSMLAGCGCRMTPKNPTVPVTPTPSVSPTPNRDKLVKDVYSNHFSIGAAFNEFNLNSELISHFNSLTCENAMKWVSVHPSKGTYIFTEADKYVVAAKENNMGVRGHALVWHNEQAMPNEFLFDDGELKSKEEYLEIQKDHIRTVMSHFKDDVYCWDVCNEVIDDGVTPIKEDESNVYRQSNLYKICGRDFIKEAYIEADKILKELGIRDKVKLFYNDYDNTKEAKREKTLAMLNWLKEENIPLDGIGLQCHYHLGSFNPQELEDSIVAYSSLGLDVQITEFDVDIYDETLVEITEYPTYLDVPEESIKIQATIYDRAFEIFRKHSDKISNVTFWGVADNVCYMNDNKDYGYRRNYPFLFDVVEGRKPAFYLIMDYDGASTSNRYSDPYNFYEDREDEPINTYANDGQDFHLKGFYASDYGQIETEANVDGSTNVSYSKQYGFEYTNLFTTVLGRVADFTYLNFKAKGTPGKGIAFRLYYGNKDDELHNILGNDVSFSLSEDYAIHSLKVRGTLKTRMDMLKKVCIFPEIGLSGSIGSFSFEDIWFSKELPEGATWENQGVDTGDTSVTVNGWKTEGWTQYTLYNLNGSTGVSYSMPGEWGYISKDLEIDEDHNALKFVFENKFLSKKPSVTVIHFLLRGDVAYHVDQDVEYEYDVFYDSEIYVYDLTKEDEVQPDENGLTTLSLPLAGAIDDIGEHNQNGYRLILNIESNPNDTSKYSRYRGGEMVIHEASLYRDDNIEIDPYSQYGESVYTISKKDGVERNITYENVKGNAFWPRICRKVSMEHNQKAVVTLRNNGTDNVRASIHAGIMNDGRSDAKNNMFYPLWSAKKGEKEDQGYYTDGQDFTLEHDVETKIEIFVDEDEMYLDDKIDVIQFLFDTTYGDVEVRSGDIDIVSIEIVDR